MRRAVCIGLLLTIRAIAAGEPAPLGKLIDIGGYRLHLYCTGQGRPTVVLSPGGGDFSFVWYLVQQQVSKFARVCSYDRADSAWSDPGPGSVLNLR
jgi:pimeloyl-ACP methyl ester carboxylesterase